MHKTLHIFSVAVIVCVVATKIITAIPIQPIPLNEQLLKAARKDDDDTVEEIIKQHSIDWFMQTKTNRNGMPIETLIRYYNSIWVKIPSPVPILYNFKHKKRLPAERELVRSTILTLIKKALSEQKQIFNKELNDNQLIVRTKRTGTRSTNKQTFWADLLCSDPDILKTA